MSEGIHQWHRSGVFIVNFEHVSHLVLIISITDFEHINKALYLTLKMIFLLFTFVMIKTYRSIVSKVRIALPVNY